MPQLRINKHLIVTILAFIVPLVAFLWLKQSGRFPDFNVWANNNFLLFIVVVFIFKTIGYIYPPMPGGIFTLASVPVIGWLNAYLLDLAGTVVGSTVAYILGRKYGVGFLQKLLDAVTIEKIKNLKIKKNRELESIFMFRILVGSFAEAIAYGAGVLKIGFGNFMVATIVSHAVLGIPAYYLAKNIFSAPNMIVSIVLAGVFIWLLYKLKGRYFE